MDYDRWKQDREEIEENDDYMHWDDYTDMQAHVESLLKAVYKSGDLDLLELHLKAIATIMEIDPPKYCKPVLMRIEYES